MTMLTVKQPTHYGYKSVHDLPTPPSTSRPSPPLVFLESSYKPLPAIPRSHSPPGKPMSAPHRGLPPPAAMTLPPQPPPASSHPPPPPSGPPAHAPAPHLHSHALGQLPGPPPQWQGAEDSMRSWLAAKTEEERRRQEEEKTRQETLRLEQRKIEAEMLRASLSGGIPPPIVPLVFAGMSGAILPPAALEWAQQFLMPHAQAHPPQLLPPQGPVSPEHRRDSQSQGYGQYQNVPSTPGSAQGPPGGFVNYPGSPTRGRGHSLSLAGPGARPLGSSSNLPSLNTNVPQPGPPGTSAMQGHQGLPMQQPQSAQTQQEAQPSPSIYFHHWHPPSSQAGGGATQPATPSVGESPRNKRKATGPQQAAPPPSQQRFRSPPFVQQSGSTVGNPPPGRRRGHSRQRSDISSYRPTGRGRPDNFGPQRGISPTQTSGPGGLREGGGAGESNQQQPRSGGGHSVSSLLSEEPSQAPQYRSSSTDMRQQQGEGIEQQRRRSPLSGE